MAEKRVSYRRVQKLGTSSLVVTLPKEWTLRVGLKPGDNVMVVDEGSWLRIVPSEYAGEVSVPVKLDASRLPVCVSRLVSCAYMMRLDEVVVAGVDAMEALKAKSLAAKLMGAEVLSVDNALLFRVMLDDSRVHAEDMVREAAHIAVELIGLVERLLEEPSQQLVQLAREAYNEIVKYEHLAVRRLTGSIPGPEQARVYAAAILGDVAADLWSLANMVASLIETRGRVEAGDRVRGLLGETAKLLEKLPNAKSVEEFSSLSKEAERLRMESYRATLDAEKPVEAAIAATLHHALRYLTVAIDALLCTRLVQK